MDIANQEHKSRIVADRIVIIIFVVVAAGLLPMMIMRDFTPSNELRYLGIADEALRSGRLFAFTNHGEIYADKPPLYFWIVMLGRSMFGCHQMWFLSLFSLLPAFAVAIIFDLWIKDKVAPQIRITAMLLLLSSDLFVGAGVVLRMDMLMCMFIVMAFYLFYQMEVNGRSVKAYSYLFPICIFLALFTKGPLGLLIPLAGTISYLSLIGRRKAIRCYWGIKTWGILLIASIVWFSLVYKEGGIEFIKNQLLHQTFGRAVNSFRHDHPFYYYLITYWYSIAPWSLLGAGCLVEGIRRHIIQSTEEKFFLTVAVSTFVLLTLISSKLEIYMLPAIPFFVYFTALVLPKMIDSKIVKLSLFIPAVIFALAFPAFIVADNRGLLDIPLQPLTIAAVIASVAGELSLVTLFCNNISYSIGSLFCGLFVAAFCIGLKMPVLNRYVGYRHVCQRAQQIAEEYNLSDIYVYKLDRPNDIDVYTRQPVMIIKEGEESRFNKRGVVIIPQMESCGKKYYESIRFEDTPYTILVYLNSATL